jgi:hypothetical protein
MSEENFYQLINKIATEVAERTADKIFMLIENKLKNKIELKNRLLTISQWTKYYDYPTEGGLRHLIFNEKLNGFEKVVKRIGRRVLIDEEAFFKWAQENHKVDYTKGMTKYKRNIR